MKDIHPDAIERELARISEFPSAEALGKAAALAREIVFPLRFCSVEARIDELRGILGAQILHSLTFDGCRAADNCAARSAAIVSEFISAMPLIKRMLHSDVRAIYANDPAVDSYVEVILCYPAVTAMLHYRMAHELMRLGVPMLPRMLTEMAHSLTGIDIHPAARIGERFAIDHGTGVVIGETCVIGNGVTVYQGVTLGAKNFCPDSNGHPMKTLRHPIIEDGVTIYANATVLGRVTVGAHSVIGGNVWLTRSVPPGSRIIQGQEHNNN